MSLQNTPSSERVHIGFFGCRNSSIVGCCRCYTYCHQFHFQRIRTVCMGQRFRQNRQNAYFSYFIGIAGRDFRIAYFRSGAGCFFGVGVYRFVVLRRRIRRNALVYFGRIRRTKNGDSLRRSAHCLGLRRYFRTTNCRLLKRQFRRKCGALHFYFGSHFIGNRLFNYFAFKKRTV